jgi:hypothetical protein
VEKFMADRVCIQVADWLTDWHFTPQIGERCPSLNPSIDRKGPRTRINPAGRLRQLSTGRQPRRILSTSDSGEIQGVGKGHKESINERTVTSALPPDLTGVGIVIDSDEFRIIHENRLSDRSTSGVNFKRRKPAGC